MTITSTKLTRAAGLCAVTAGLLFIVVQFIHPHEDVAAVVTTRWAVTHYLTLTMAILGLAGVAGIYLRQVTEVGLLGLAGFVLFALFFVIVAAATFVEAFILPSLAAQAPAFVTDVLAVTSGGTVVGDVGALKYVGGASAVTYLLGGLLFGVALFRARLLARWPALLLVGGTVATILVPVLPHLLDRALALPTGLALAGLGWSLASIRTARGVRLAPVAVS